MKHREFSETLAFYHREVPDDPKYGQFLTDLQVEYVKSDDSTAEVLFEFLNKWGRMRLAKDASSVRALSKTIAGLRAYIDLFKLLRIEDVDLNSQIKIGTESVTVTTAVVMMFETFLLTGHKIADVAATKCLHLLSPSFFVIWDNSTRDELTPRSRSYSLRYAAQFLPLVQGHIAELIQDTGEALNLSRPKAIETIERAGPAQRTLAKRIDEYFYTRFTKGFIPKPKSCGACG